MTRYEIGFLTKCAEHRLTKQAAVALLKTAVEKLKLPSQMVEGWNDYDRQNGYPRPIPKPITESQMNNFMDYFDRAHSAISKIAPYHPAPGETGDGDYSSNRYFNFIQHGIEGAAELAKRTADQYNIDAGWGRTRRSQYGEKPYEDYYSTPYRHYGYNYEGDHPNYGYNGDGYSPMTNLSSHEGLAFESYPREYNHFVRNFNKKWATPPSGKPAKFDGVDM